MYFRNNYTYARIREYISTILKVQGNSLVKFLHNIKTYSTYLVDRIMYLKLQQNVYQL